ncbi:MAG: BON domain-containing protein [Caldilineaceae bacterium]|nr:BON domain-containing protein [Caldilineaceae bacterium]
MTKQDSRRNQQERDNRDNTWATDRVGSLAGDRESQWGDPTDPPVVEVSLEEILELQDEMEGDDSLGDIIDTGTTDGSTNNVQMAMDQGLVWDPPTDPPVIPSDDLQGVEIAAGFASSIDGDDGDLEVENFPDRVDDNDSDLEDDLRRALRYNSETSHLENIRVYVRNGIVYLRGTVLDDDDISIVDEFIRDTKNVRGVRNELEVAE